MKILIATGIFIPEIGGPATYAAKLADELLALKHEVAVLTYSKNEIYQGDGKLDYKVKRVPRVNKIKNYFNYYKALKEMMEEDSYDVIYAFDHFSAGIPVSLLNRKLKKKLIIRVGGDFIWERYLDRMEDLVTLREFYKKDLHLTAEKIRFLLIKWVFRQADKIIFTTKFQRDIFMPAYNIKQEKTDIIDNPVDVIAKRETIKSVTRDIVFAGRFINKNNIFFLIDAFMEMEDRSFNLHLVGEGPLKEKIEKYILELKTKRIVVVDKLVGQALLDKFREAYIVVFPSLTDISPNTLLECLNSSVPFISTTEIGYEWFSGKVEQFSPQNRQALVNILNKLAVGKEYSDYRQQLAELNYTHTYKEAALETINIINQITL